MKTLTATRSIAAPLTEVADIIMDIGALAEWNPALIATHTDDAVANVGTSYAVTTRVPGRASLTFEYAAKGRIQWRLDVAGGTEVGIWQLEQRGADTSVTHTMQHSGPLLTLMRNAMAQVPTWRLDRLQERAER